jgi:membrane protease YdiL (CAAX protease family)
MNELHWLDHVLVLILVLGLPLNSIVQGKHQLPNRLDWTASDKIKFYWTNAAALWGLFATVVMIWWISGKDMILLIDKFKIPHWSPLALILVMIVITAYFFELFWSTHPKLDKEATVKRLSQQTPFLPSQEKEWSHYIGLAITAGICEEVVFRFYLLSYWIQLTNQIIIGLMLSSVLFGAVHFYQGYRAMFKIGALSFLLGWLFILTESLLIPIILHVFIDVVSGRMAYKLFR